MTFQRKAAATAKHPYKGYNDQKAKLSKSAAKMLYRLVAQYKTHRFAFVKRSKFLHHFVGSTMVSFAQEKGCDFRTQG